MPIQTLSNGRLFFNLVDAYADWSKMVNVVFWEVAATGLDGPKDD